MAVRTYLKGQVAKIGNGVFTLSEFECHCKRPQCTTTLLDDELVAGLEQLADVLGKPRVNSGFRCAEHNREVGGLPDSQHLLGHAADVASSFSSPVEIANAAAKIKCFQDGGIGLYPKFVHLDNRGKRARWNAPTTC